MERETALNIKGQQEQLAIAMLRSFEDFIFCVCGIADNNSRMD